MIYMMLSILVKFLTDNLQVARYIQTIYTCMTQLVRITGQT